MRVFDLTLIVPCFNEEKRFTASVWASYLQQHPQFLFVFVNDGSTDNTQDFMAQLEAGHNNVSIVNLAKNSGKAQAVRAGMLQALEKNASPMLGFIDADLAIPLSEINRFVQLLAQEQHVDIVIGSRVQMLGKKIKRNTLRHYMSRFVATCICKILDEPVYDTQCGLKIFRQPAAAALVQDGFISKWLFDVELLARYKTLFGSTAFNEKITELPLNQWTETQRSKLRLHHLPVIAIDLFKIWRKYFTYNKPEAGPCVGVGHQL